MRAVPELNAQDLDYPNYGFKLFGATINSNSAFRTFGELMGVPVPGFSRRLQPGIGNYMLPRERIAALCYRERVEEDRQRVCTPGSDAIRQDARNHTMPRQIRSNV